MLARGGYADQDIQAYFTRPTRTVNHRAFSEIRTGVKHESVKSATEETLDAYLAAWPDVDPDTDLSRTGDELLIKVREDVRIQEVPHRRPYGLVAKAGRQGPKQRLRLPR